MDDSVSRHIIESIKNALSHDSCFPVAEVTQTGAIRITCLKDSDEDQSISNFSKEFEVLCAKHQLPKLAAGDSYVTEQRHGDSNKVEHVFHISADNFDRLLIAESEIYQGYREGNSILRLAHQDKQAYKEGMLCLFPVADLGDGNLLMRTAGCNTSEITSTQLAYLVNKYIPTPTHPSFFGHHHAPLTRDEIASDQQLLMDAVTTCIGLSGSAEAGMLSNHQALDGSQTISLQSAYKQYLQPMNPAAEDIYRILGAAPPEELPHLQSVEIPMAIFLEELNRIELPNKNTRSTMINCKAISATRKLET